MCVIGGFAVALCTRYRPLNAPFAPVVGRKRQLPIVEETVEVVEVVERRAGAFQDVLTVVAPKILSKCVSFSGEKNPL